MRVMRMDHALPVLVVLLLLGAMMLPGAGGETRQVEDFGGFWRFDEGSGTIAADDGDLGNDGTIVGATWVDGVLGTGLGFDGNDFVTVPDDPTMEPGGEDFTLQLWFKTSTRASQMLVSKWDPTDHGFFLRLNANSTISYFISDGTNQSGASVSFEYDDNRWHLVSMVRDNMYDSLTLYIDGDEWDEVGDLPGNLTDTTAPLTIAKPSWSTAEDHFIGSLDEVTFEDGAAWGFAIWYYYLVVSTFMDVIGFWAYDEDLGPVVEDLSPNENNGTATGITYVDGVDVLCGRFSGVTGQHVVVPHANSLNIFDSFSIQMWVRTSETFQTQDLVGKYSPSALNTGFYTRINPAGGSQGQEGAFVFSVNPQTAYRASSVSVADGEWHYLVGVYNVSGKLDVYVDGELANGPLGGAVPTSIANNDQPLLMGKGFDGDLDEVIMYSVALSADEVMERYLSYEISRPPQIDELGEFTALEDQESVFYLSSYISDPDTPLAWLEIDTDSPNCTVVGQDLQFLYTRGGVDEVVNVTVSDGEGYDTAQLVVHVQEVNDPPVISGIPTQRLTEDEAGVVDLAKYISDEETDTEDLTIFCEHPNLLDVDNYCLTFLFPSPVDRQRVNISVYDGTNFTYGTFNIEVTDVNDPPLIEGLGELVLPFDIVVDEGTTQWYAIRVSDEDDDEFDYEVDNNWSGFTVFENGTLRVTAAKGAVGSFNGTLTVSDWNGANSSIMLKVEVVNVNDPPSEPIITSPSNGALFTEGDLVNFTVEVTDPDQPLGDVLTVKWRSSLAGTLADLTYGEDPPFSTTDLLPGVHQITVEVSDGTYTRVANINITVREAQDSSSEGLLSSPVAIGGIIALVILVVVGVVLILMFTKKKKEEVPGPAPGGPPETLPAPPPGYQAPPGQGPPTGPGAVGAPGASGPADVTVETAVGTGPAARPAGSPETMAMQAPGEQAKPYTPPPAPGTWKDRTFSVKDLKVAGPAVELPKGGAGTVGRATGVFQANPDLPSVTLKKMEAPTVPVVSVEEERKKADRETEILAMSNTILRIPGGLTRRLMGYDMWDLAAKVVDAEKVPTTDGKPVITIDGRQYYADHTNLDTFLSEVPTEEEEEERPKKRPSKKGKKEAAAKVDDEAARREMLEKLDQRLIDGDISEETYERLRKKYGGD